MDSKNILTIVIVSCVVILGSLFLGTAAGTQDITTTGGFVVALIAIAAFLGLNKNVWILIPAFAAWSGSVTFLPIPFSLANIIIGFSGFTILSLVATRKIKLRFEVSAFDILIGILLLILIAGYFRNPVGIASLMGGAKVGGRPYAEIMIALMGYVLLSSTEINRRLCEKLPLLVLVTSSILFVGGTIAFFIPTAGLVLSQLYSGFAPNVSELIDPYGDSDGIGRAGFIRPMAFTLVAWALASRSPLKASIPITIPHAWMLYAGTIGALLSGFRGAIFQVACMFIIASWAWLRGIGLILCAGFALLVMSTAVFIQEFYPLPERLQRPLSMLPGNWDQHVLDDTESSNEWRFEMWEQVIEGETVKNWWIGDGFGFPRAELEYYGELYIMGALTPEQLAEYFVLTGGLHSGPLSSLKFVGLLGLVVFIALALLLAIRYGKLWKTMRKEFGATDKLTITIGFFALSAMYFPIKFTLIYGQFDKDTGIFLINLGIYKILEKAAQSHQKNKKDNERF